MEVYACGNCGGALELKKDEKTSLCIYCGYTNDLGDLRESLEEFKKEVASWLTNIGAVGGSGLDLGMRSIYFRDSIYPGLLTEFSNIAGDTDDVLNLPLFYLQVYNMIPELEVDTSWSPSQGKPLKEFSRKLESPDLMSFASAGESQRLLCELRLRSLMMPMLMDVIELSSNPNNENLRYCSQTIEKLATETKNLLANESMLEGADDYKQYYELLSRRFSVSSEAFSTFAEASSGSSEIDEEWLTKSIGALNESIHTLADISSISVTDKVLLGSGIENDINAITAGYDLIKLYPTITASDYSIFVNAITKLANQTLFRMPREDGPDLSWFTFGIDSAKFSWFLKQLSFIFRREFYHIMAPTDDVGSWITKQASNTFVLYPFYLSKVKTVLKSGFLLWKKGEEEEFFSLCDAAFNLYAGFSEGDYPSLMTPGFKKMLGSPKEELISSLSKAEGRKKPENWLALPPTVSSEDIRAIYSAAHNYLEEADLAATEGLPVTIPRSYKKQGFDAGKVKALSAEVLDLVFLPMALSPSGGIIMGKHLGLEETLPHRVELYSAFSEFMKEISSEG
ncbi:MAG: hypothetical protein ACFFCX_16915 [Candidatus Sifarchaeia archaeon]